MADAVEIAVSDCECCGEDHDIVRARPLALALGDDAPPAYGVTHWAPCPITGDTLLLGVRR